jgi:hypothetical protein
VYFNKKNSYANCYEEIRDNSISLNTDKDKIDELIIRNDSVIYTNGQNTFIFKPKTELEDYWETNGVTITCSEISTLDIFGTQDSIKTFTCLGGGFDDIEFILSKNFGLVKFLPIQKFFTNSTLNQPKYFELIGLKDSSNTIGYIQPDFSDYFHLNTGDVLYWKHYLHNNDIQEPNKTFYYRDSITSAYISSDSVYYLFKRYVHTDGELTNEYYDDIFHLRKKEEIRLSNHISWLVLDTNIEYGSNIFEFNKLHYKIENSDTISYADFYNEMYLDTSSNCMLVYETNGISFSFSTKYGIIHRGSYSCYGYSTLDLIGSIIDGVESGYTHVTDITEISKIDFKIYPNPFENYVRIKTNDIHLTYRVTITDLVGRLIYKTEVNEDIIYMNDLKKGIYLLNIVDSKNRRHQTTIIKK